MVWAGGGGGKYTRPVERWAFMTDWKDYWVSLLHHTPSHTLGLISVTDVYNQRTTYSRQVEISAVDDVSSLPAIPGGFSCHQCTAVKVTGTTGTKKHVCDCVMVYVPHYTAFKAPG